MDTSEDGRWFLVEEAAKLLAITSDGIRKRVKRGQLEARRGNDGLIRVLVPSEMVLDQSETVSDGIGSVLDNLRQERDAARAEAERWRGTAEERGQALARAEGESTMMRERIEDLKAQLERERTRADDLAAPLRELVDQLKAQVARERGRRHEVEARLAQPWWRRLGGG